MAMTEWEIHRTIVSQKKIQVLLCDDDSAFLADLKKEVARSFEKLNINANMETFVRPTDISSELLEICDLVFLDIDFEKEGCNGIDIARKLREVNSHAQIFFVTNFIDYAPEGYEVQAFRYILKRDMEEVLERYIMQAMERFAEGKEFLRIQNRDESTDIPLDKISYLEVMNHSVSIHLKDCLYELNATLSGLEERLATHGFLRIHKSYLVNMRYISKFRSRECLLSEGTVLSVSERNYAQQKQKYLLWKGLK